MSIDEVIAKLRASDGTCDPQLDADFGRVVGHFAGHYDGIDGENVWLESIIARSYNSSRYWAEITTRNKRGGSMRRDADLPEFTSDIREALACLPKGWRVMVSEWDDEKHLRPMGPWQCICWPAGEGDTLHLATFHTRCKHAPTMGLAVAIAVLETIRWMRKQEQSS